MKVKYNIEVTLDTESNTDGSLYLIAIYNPDMGYELFYDLNSLYNRLEQLGNVKCYVHNYANWDSYFLHNKEINKRYEIHNMLNNQRKVLSLTYKHKDGYIRFEDTYPRATVSLEDFAKSIDSEYENIPDYEEYRKPQDPSSWTDRDEVEKYIKKDVKILWELIQTFRLVFGESFDRTLSAGSMVWMENVNQRHEKPFMAYQRFRKDYPALTHEVDQMIRPSFMGGITSTFFHNGIVLDKNSLKELYPGFRKPRIYGEDISSAYGAAQIKKIPNGRYRYLYEEDMEYLKSNIMNEDVIIFTNIKYSYDSAKFPLIPKMSMKPTDEYSWVLDGSTYTYNEESVYMESMIFGTEDIGIAAVSTLDLRVAIENDVYENFKYEFIPFNNTKVIGVMFDMKEDPYMKSITEKYYYLKNNAENAGLRTAYKMPLLNLFGKLGERFYTSEYKIDIESREMETIELEEPKVPKYSNVAMSAVISSYCHHELYYKSQEVGGIQNILYMDTDSIYYVSEEQTPISKSEELGVWMPDVLIGEYDRALFISPKRYIIEDKDGNIIKKASSGIDKKDTTFNITEWTNGKRVFNNIIRRVVPGGVKLVKDLVDISDSFNTEDTWYLN